MSTGSKNGKDKKVIKTFAFNTTSQISCDLSIIVAMREKIGRSNAANHLCSARLPSYI
jgi:hypothetical protein